MNLDERWEGAQYVERWVGEVRINLVRLAALAAFYAQHLFTRYTNPAEIDPRFHLVVTGIVVAWSAAAVALHVVLVRRWSPPWLRTAVVFWDTVMTTAVLLAADGPKSPLVLLYFLLLASASIRLDLGLVWAATALSIASYAFVCGQAKWVRPEMNIPRSRQVIFAIGLACAGLLAGQAVRQARRLALDYGDRVRDPAAGSAATEGRGGDA